MEMTDTIETTSPPSSQSASVHFSSQPCHFYVAVDRLQFKMVSLSVSLCLRVFVCAFFKWNFINRNRQETLVDLLRVAGRRHGLPMVVCCSSRDELDAVCAAVSNLPHISAASLYSDLSESERILILEKFRQATMMWNQNATSQLADDCETENFESKSHMIIVTDACLPLLASGESPISARVLINYELPAKKETYMRRMATCLAADGIVINMVVGGEVVTLKVVEESSNLVITEMPINISEIL